MTFLTAIAVSLVVILALCLWSCYNTNKPLRERARNEAEQLAKQKLASEEAGRERARRDNQEREVIQILEDILSNPNRQRGKQRIPAIEALIYQLQVRTDTSDQLKMHQSRIQKQADLLHAVQLNQRDIHKALGLGQPVE